MSDKENKLAVFLREGRIKCNLSQKDVSDYLGYDTPQFISNWERGLASPPISILKKLADFYKISGEKLFQVVLQEELRQTALQLQEKFRQSKS